jgi:lipopolysaccharide transport system permease protein
MSTIAEQQPFLRIRPSRGFAALRLTEVWQFRDLLFALAQRDVKLRYKQTALGVIWVVLQPLLAAGIFSFVFGLVAKMPSDGRSYFLFSYAGLLGWNLFFSVVTRSSGCLIGNSQLISKIFFPRLVLPFSTVPSALIDFGVALAMMAVLMLVYHVHPTANLLLLPAWILLALMVSCGIGLWTSALSVSYRDVQYILPIMLQILLYGSPVAYAVSAVPQRLRWAYQLNPLASILEGFRWSLLGTTAPDWRAVLLSAIVSMLLLASGAFAFKRMERKFADVI